MHYLDNLNSQKTTLRIGTLSIESDITSLMKSIKSSATSGEQYIYSTLILLANSVIIKCIRWNVISELYVFQSF